MDRMVKVKTSDKTGDKTSGKTGGVVAIVPARGGSKSIRRKTIRSLGGVPLLAYSIEAGLTARSVDRVIVSTDDDEIAAIARGWGADVPFMRPAALAEDSTPDLPVFQHALEWLETHDRWIPDIVVQLRPTSPLRPPGCVDSAVERLRVDAAADSVRAVVVASQNPYKMWRVNADGAMAPLLDREGPESYNRPRQELPVTYWQTGHVDAIRVATLRDKTSMTGTRIVPLLIDPIYTSDIDTEADWRQSEWIVAHFDRPLVRPHTGDARLPEDLRLIVFDFDGVLTDNRVWVNGGGEEWVACDRSDGLGLERLRGLDVELFVLSKETNPVVGARCDKLRLAYEQGVSDKRSYLRTMLAERRIDPSQVIYVGNDINDLECMQLVGCAVAVADAYPEVIAEADVVLTRPGGHGAVRELCDRVRAHVSSRATR
jgi:YrbI family 3-deoxy-D-manno-octulosonate 8-phosphate phosphatase